MIKKTILVIIFILFLSLFQTVSGEENTETSENTNKIYVEYYYNKICGSCTDKLNDFVKVVEEKYKNNSNVVFYEKEISENETNNDKYLYYKNLLGLNSWPFLVIKNETNASAIPGRMLYIKYIEDTTDVIDAYLAGIKPKNVVDKDVVPFDFLFWHFEIDTSSISLPVLTIILGSLDSFNPCAFFILIFLLNLLLYTKSRKRMILIGSIFIFFSGLLYAVFMFILYETFVITRPYVLIVNIIAGAIALTLGIFNIKDFFYFKKGASLSIPDDKKPEIFKKMRNLVKNPRLTSTIMGTIILAGTINFYELLCTLGLPLVFTRRLDSYGFSPVESAMYIFFYNLVYVIPLIIIVLIFIFTLGRRKITEWHGQILKLMSGIMLLCFGFLFLFNYQLLENVITPILLLLISLLSTFVISYIWKKTKNIET